MDNSKQQKRSAFIVNVIFFAMVAALFYFSVKYVLGWLMPFLIGFIIALIFRPLIYWAVDRLHFKQRFAAVAVVLLGYCVLGTLLALLGMELVSVLGHLFSDLPDYFTNTIMPALSAWGDNFDNLLSRMPAEWLAILDTLRTSITSALMNVVSNLSKVGLNLVANVAKSVPGALIAFVFTILASFFISQNYYGVIRFIAAQFPDKARKALREGRDAITGTLGAYLKAYARIMLVTFTELTIGFLIIGVKNPIPTAFGIALFDIFPVFGTGGIVIPWIVLDLLLGKYSQALGLLIIYGVVTVVRNFIEPKIVGDQLGLNPIVSIIAIYLGYRWFGFAGMLLMPATCALAITLHNKGVITLYKESGPVDENLERERREAVRLEKTERRRTRRAEWREHLTISLNKERKNTKND